MALPPSGSGWLEVPIAAEPDKEDDARVCAADASSRGAHDSGSWPRAPLPLEMDRVGWQRRQSDAHERVWNKTRRGGARRPAAKSMARAETGSRPETRSFRAPSKTAGKMYGPIGRRQGLGQDALRIGAPTLVLAIAKPDAQSFPQTHLPAQNVYGAVRTQSWRASQRHGGTNVRAPAR